MIPLWKFLPASVAHQLAPIGIRFYSDLASDVSSHWRPLAWRGLAFQNRLGIAGGVDKNAELIESWANLGFGFAEIGTVTPRPQNANPGKILDRDWEQKLLWNRMGFPNAGQWDVRARLQSVGPQPIPIFLNVGKNRETSAEKAYEDYAEVTRHLIPYVDAVVVNISSPNTQGLRALQSKDSVGSLIEKVVAEAQGQPVLVKFSPDENEVSLQDSLDTAATSGAEGFILTNTTLTRPADSRWPESGGLSGAFLREASLRALKVAVRHFQNAPNRPLLVSTGGVLTPEDVAQRLDLGADLVQVYAALVFSGPGFARQVAAHFQKEGQA